MVMVIDNVIYTLGYIIRFWIMLLLILFFLLGQHSSKKPKDLVISNRLLAAR